MKEIMYCMKQSSITGGRALSDLGWFYGGSVPLDLITATKINKWLDQLRSEAEEPSRETLLRNFVWLKV